MCVDRSESVRGLRSRRSWSRVTRFDGQFKIHRHKAIKAETLLMIFNSFSFLLRLTDHESTRHTGQGSGSGATPKIKEAQDEIFRVDIYCNWIYFDSYCTLPPESRPEATASDDLRLLPILLLLPLNSLGSKPGKEKQRKVSITIFFFSLLLSLPRLKTVLWPLRVLALGSIAVCLCLAVDTKGARRSEERNQ